MSRKSSFRSDRFRIFCGVCYPEHTGNQNETAKFLYELFGSGVAVSPLHNRDLQNISCCPRDFSITRDIAVYDKPHYHFILSFNNQKSLAVVRSVLGTLGKVEKLKTTKRAMLRYFLHLDNPEKFQYQSYGGEIVAIDFSMEDYYHEGNMEAMKIIANLCVNNDFRDIQDLIFFLSSSNAYQHLLLNVSKQTFFYKEFVKSFTRYKK